MIKKLKIGLGALFALCLLSVSAFPLAASAQTFDPSRIIDDSVFDNKSSMSAAQIDAFLNSFPSSCLSTNNHFTAPDPIGYNIDQGYLFGSNVSGGTAIAHAAQAYDLNPQVLLATLQKEQSLVSGGKGCYPNTPDASTATPCDLYGNGRIYNCTNACPFAYGGGCIPIAVGYGCPGRCDAAKEGFSNQIIRAAWLLKFSEQRAKGNINWAIVRGNWDNSDDLDTCYSGPMIKGNWQVCPSGGTSPYDGLYTPKDGTTIELKTGATAALYYYTPFLSGNQSFFNIFTGWFGTTMGTPFFQLPGSVKTYMLGADNTYYYIPSPNIMTAYGYGSKFKSINQMSANFVDGMTLKGNLPLIARFEGPGVFVVNASTLHPFPSEDIFNAYGYVFGDEASLPSWVSSYLPESTPVWQVARLSDGATIYYVNGGKKQAFCSWDAYTKLGVPTYATQSYVSLPKSYINTIPNGPPIAMDGDVIVSSDTGDVGVWQNSLFSPIDKTVATNTGTINCAVPNDAAKQLPAGPAINNLVKDSSDHYYILDNKKKFSITSSGMPAYNITTGDFVGVSSAFLGRVPTAAQLNTILRVNNGLGVYIIQTGKSYGVATESDLYGLGYNFNQVQNVAKTTYGIVQPGGIIFKPNRLVRASGSLGVYLLDDTFNKHPFTSEQAFLNYGEAWSDVLVVSSSTLSAYTDGAPASFYIKENDNLYWIMDRGIKHRVPSTLVSSGYNITSQNSVALPVSVLTHYPMTSTPIGKLLRAENGRGVYLIENGKKRVFASEQAMFNAGYSWQDVQVMSPYFVASIPDGEPIF
jgi:hypothetical protein